MPHKFDIAKSFTVATFIMHNFLYLDFSTQSIRASLITETAVISKILEAMREEKKKKRWALLQIQDDSCSWKGTQNMDKSLDRTGQDRTNPSYPE